MKWAVSGGKLILLISFFILVLLASLAKKSTSLPPTDRLVAIAREYIQVHRPDWGRTLENPAEVRDRGTCWEVELIPLTPRNPDNPTIPRGPVVKIDKKTLQPIAAFDYSQ
ncbi:MAG: hypothetical protein WC869_10060 [Phycisphaerae bacterium]